MSELTPQKIDPDKNQGELFPADDLFREMLDVERQRIETANRKIETARLHIESSDAADKRQFEYQMNRLQIRENDDIRRHSLIRIIIIWGGASALLTLTILIGLMFWGEPQQSELATTVFKYLFIGIGGYGVLTGVSHAIKRFLSSYFSQ